METYNKALKDNKQKSNEQSLKEANNINNNLLYKKETSNKN